MSENVNDTEEILGSNIEVQGFAFGEEGDIQIQNDVLARIVEIATVEVDGVALENKFQLADLIGRKDKETLRGIQVERDESDNSVNVAVSVRMHYGRDMYDLAVKLRRHIKDTLQKMTRVVVRRVDVKIVGIIVVERQAQKAETASVESGETEE